MNSTLSVPNNFDLRLVGGPTNRSGRLEIYIGGIWGTIRRENSPDNGFQISTIACRQLGFAGTGHTSGHTYTGDNSSLPVRPMLLKIVGCSLDETRLIYCEHRPVGNYTFEPFQSIFIKCKLADWMNGVEGWKSLQAGNKVLFVESPSHKPKPQFVCRLLGFDGRPAKLLSSRLRLPQMGTVSCFGSSTYSWYCEHDNWNISDCNASGYAWIECPLFKDYRARMRTKSRYFNTIRGPLDVMVGQRWLPLCGNIDRKGVELACERMGYPSSGSQVFSRAYIHPESDSKVLLNVECPRSVHMFTECNFTATDQSTVDVNCSMMTGIACVDGDYPLRLVSGDDDISGRLEIFVKGHWGRVCGHLFDQKAAQVVCRQLAFRHAGTVDYSPSETIHDSTEVLITNVECNGSEMNLKYCKYEIVDDNRCDAGKNVHLTCVVKPVELHPMFFGAGGILIFACLVCIGICCKRKKRLRSYTQDRQFTLSVNLHASNSEPRVHMSLPSDSNLRRTFPSEQDAPPKYQELFPNVGPVNGNLTLPPPYEDIPPQTVQ